ncbi:MAG: Ig-like domain-containing protein [Kofleriaceae bacterium]|nr:Ig-like domain-containing protein [Kofleriaceae bacterium]MCB9573987.1 Ig-like domain-containing protein [Kofleriaceae bacterium]
MRTHPHTPKLILALLLGAAAAGCAGSGGGGDDVAPADGAKLTIVGERSLLMENGWSNEITVRYTDLDGNPLAGQIDFTLDGTVGGSYLSSVTATTDADGEASVELTAGETGDLTFQVAATAEAADGVAWDVQVLQHALEITGDYRLSSEFDLATGLPGTAGQVVNTFIDMTDGPYDPATWVLDQIIAKISNATVRDLINGARPAIDGLLNDLLLSNSPDIVARLIEMGDAFGQVAREFGTTSTLHVTDTNDVDAGMIAQHVLTGLVFHIDADDYAYSMHDLGMENVTADAPFGYDATRITLGAHAFPLSYGSILMVALDQLIIPLVDPTASDFEGLLTGFVDCQAVGQTISDYLGFGGSSLYAGACDLGLGFAADFVENQIRSLDATAMELGITGTARWMDTNHDHQVDVLQAGAWDGQMTYGSSPAPLGASPFHGERMQLP